MTQTLSQAAAASLRHPLTRTLLALTFTTGLIDGVSYLGLGHVFAANMTGNVVLLGFGIVGGYDLPVLAPIIAGAVFLLGAGVGGVLTRRLEHTRQIGTALSLEIGFLLAALALTALTHAADATIALLAFAMGIRNATVRKLAVPDLNTTVLTMTLTGLAAEPPGKGTARRIAAIVSMFLGALAGGLLLKVSITIPLALAAGLELVTMVIYVTSAGRSVSMRQ